MKNHGSVFYTTINYFSTIIFLFGFHKVKRDISIIFRSVFETYIFKYSSSVLVSTQNIRLFHNSIVTTKNSIMCSILRNILLSVS
jgi:hypothetical protein